MIIVQNLIYEIRGQKVMLDFDLARLYQVDTRVLNQSVKRNLKRFPPDFMFQLTLEETKAMMSQNVISSRRKASAPPFAFTEQGVAMQREEDLGAMNDLSEDVQKDIDNLYLAIGELATRLEEKKDEPRRRIGFKENINP